MYKKKHKDHKKDKKKIKKKLNDKYFYFKINVHIYIYQNLLKSTFYNVF